MSIVLSKIYTRTGDDGTTALGDGARVGKASTRIDAYAATDAANASLGVALALGDLSEPVAAEVRRMQHDLFDVGADLCTPLPDEDGALRLRVTQEYVDRLERACDEFGDELPTLRSFILPGGRPGAALLHVSRTALRDAERQVWRLLDEEPEATNPLTAKYLNRASDLMFILSRVANDGGERDVLWQPGKNRE
ncbi:MAG: cob(I)yrinic acid a,c-diamide adenosyltransferase [Actinomycetales bacterium]